MNNLTDRRRPGDERDGQGDASEEDEIGTDAEVSEGEPIGSDQVGGYFLESLISARDALDLLQLHLHDSTNGDSKDPARPIRRVAHGLRASAAAFGFPQVIGAAAEVEQASNGTIEPRLGRLIELLNDVVENEPSHKVRILVVESDPDIADLLWFTLSTPNRSIDIANTAAEAEEMLERHAVSLIVLDLDLKEVAGQDVLMKLRSRSRTAFIPTLVLSNEDSAALKMECLALGADAFYAKPFDPAEISSMVSVRLQRRAFIDSKDPLTGLPDRVAFEESFERVRKVYRSSSQALSLAVLDFDHFEQVNEIYGHAVGDRVLRRSADLISRSLRSSDVLARWKGQVFTLLFPNARTAEADDVLYRALQSVQHERFAAQSGKRFRISFSAGVSEVSADESLESAFLRARRSMEAAKEGGGGRILWEGKHAERRGDKIMVVEDDDLIAKLVTQRLGREGYEAVHYDNGADAWAAVQKSPMSLVLLDVRMPGMNGFELLGRLRDLPAYRECPIIMLTAMGSESDIQRGFEMGADDYVIKPFSPIELMARIKRRLQSRTVPVVASSESLS